VTQTVILHGTRTAAHKLIDAAPAGSVCKISPPKRTEDQNALMWALLSDVSRSKPEGREYPPEIWKSLFMASAGFTPRFEPSLDGKGVVPIGYKSSRLTKAEFSDLIEAINSYGAEHGVTWTQGDPA
jgi:hypothetical protein